MLCLECCTLYFVIEKCRSPSGRERNQLQPDRAMFLVDPITSQQPVQGMSCSSSNFLRLALVSPEKIGFHCPRFSNLHVKRQLANTNLGFQLEGSDELKGWEKRDNAMQSDCLGCYTSESSDLFHIHESSLPTLACQAADRWMHLG